ncbi:hypothetical protein SK128_008966, partial [Halocaridina rubra]
KLRIRRTKSTTRAEQIGEIERKARQSQPDRPLDGSAHCLHPIDCLSVFMSSTVLLVQCLHSVLAHLRSRTLNFLDIARGRWVPYL